MISPYFKALKEELVLYEDILKERTISTVYFGGGTPSFVNSEYIQVFFNFLKDNFDLAPDSEVTIEANPETVTLEKLEKWFETGINRLSLGFQSLNPKQLEILGRIHTVEKCLEAYNLARQVGFKNINIDLIFNSPGESEDDWEETLKGAVSLEPEHLSVYELTLEPGTPLYQKVLREMNVSSKGKGHQTETDGLHPFDFGEREIIFFDSGGDIFDVETYNFTTSFLKSAGYIHYEVSNFARPNYQCRHSLNYWKLKDFLGLGCAADGFLANYRWRNFTLLEKYLETVFRGRKPFGERHFITAEEALREKLFEGLRLLEGLEIEEIVEGLAESKKENFRLKLNELESLELLKVEKGKIILTIKGLLVCNEIYARLLSSLLD